MQVTLTFGAQTSHCGGFSCCRAFALRAGAWVVAALGFSCSVAHGIFLDQGSPHVLCIGRHILNHWSTREVLLHFSLYNLSLPDFFFFNVFVFLLQQKKNRDFVWFTAAYLTWNSVLHIIDIQYLCYYLFRLHCIPCGIPVPQPGTEPGQGNESIKCWPLDCQDLPIFVGWIDESHMKLKIFKKWIWKKCGFSTELNGHINAIK